LDWNQGFWSGGLSAGFVDGVVLVDWDGPVDDDGPGLVDDGLGGELAPGLVDDAGPVCDPILPIAVGGLLQAGMVVGLLNGWEKVLLDGWRRLLCFFFLFITTK
jgi:hypothetical protein